MDVPDATGREAILKVHTRKMKLADPADLRAVAEITPGEIPFGGALENDVWVTVN